MQTENKRQKIRIGSLLVVLFLLMYIPSLFHWVYGNSVATDIIKMDAIEDSINTEGYFIRDEEVLKSPFEGKYIPEVNEGERVPASSRIATVLKDSSMDTLDELRKLDEDILKAQKEKGENQGIFSQDIVALDNDIGDKVKSMVPVSNSGSFEKYEDIKNEIDSFLKKKALILGGFGASDSHINSLKKQRDSLQSLVDLSTKQVVSKYPGVISYMVDGLEEELSPDSIKNLTPKMLEGMKVKNAQINIKDRNVEINKPFAKIIKGIDVYIAVPISIKDAGFLSVNNNVKIRVNDVNKVVDSTVIYKSGGTEGRCVVVFRTDKLTNDTAYLREADIDILKNSYTGLKVPLKSLTGISADGKKAKIILVKANYASIRNVSIEGKNDEFAVVKSDESNLNKGISLYDTFVVNPINIEEGQLINR